jgi:hypothetical protein
VLSSTLRCGMTRRTEEQLRSLLQRPPYLHKRALEHGCLSQTHPAKQARTNQSTADRYHPTHTITVVNESIMLHRYEHGLILCCDSDPIWNRLRRTGRALFSCRIPGSLTPCRSTTHVAGIPHCRARGHTSLRGFAYARCLTGLYMQFHCKVNKHIPM